MGIASIVMSAIIFSILTMGVYSQSSIIFDMEKEINQELDFKRMATAIMLYYDKTGSLPAGVGSIANELEIDINTLKDASGSSYVFLNNGGSYFTYGSSTENLIAIVAPYRDGLNSSISSNVLTVLNDEAVFVIPGAMFANTNRGKTKSKVNLCNAAVELYSANEDLTTNPLSINNLVIHDYVDGKDVIDHFGSVLKYNSSSKKCYSIGYDKADGTIDDIS